MNEINYELIYLAACALHNEKPDADRVDAADKEELLKECRFHSLTALVAYSLNAVGLKIEEFEQDKNLTIRNSLLFDAERKKIFQFFEENSIWYMSLKGILLKKYYPKIGMRQMSDNDILIDESRISDADAFMKENGYEFKTSVEAHDYGYLKKPCYNFELHRTLVGDYHSKKWFDYYKDVKSRLLKDEDNSYGYHFSNEDFYVYMKLHDYKHYSDGGIGVRSLVDDYVFNREFSDSLDYDYVDRECEKLGILEFQRKSRSLAGKLFESVSFPELSADEVEMMEFYFSSGTYGTAANAAAAKMKKIEEETGSTSKLRYIFRRIFPPLEMYRVWMPFFYKHKILLPIGWAYRLLRGIFFRRSKMMSELNEINKEHF